MPCCAAAAVALSLLASQINWFKNGSALNAMAKEFAKK
jgi:hypothetical protein